ncbi:MAG: hypothetical protein JKY48_07580 [Flavobacteriales bacterium]|nr:hypothetical protein [Flavobacteriales bacterium]
MKGLHNIDSMPKVYKIFKKVENPSGKTLAYKGAIEAIMTKITWNIFKKMYFLRESEKSFKQAVQKNPNDVEVRFMRMAVQFEIPAYLGFSEEIDTDKDFIVKHIHEFNVKNFPSDILDQILQFMYRCEKFSEVQIERFKGILALN